ncbi:MAG TPA: hybrid sensor histidine kinase/response regulator transcription factor [Streptosporangiaceae bacterium]|nr:hybrid sensor histidine kinase/response regulator transcription factor [Streptosporangiaceae bacterium]
MAAGISVVDPLLIPYADALFLIGMADAFLLGNLRDVRRAALGLAVVIVGASAIVSSIPGHSASQPVVVPLEFAISWVVRFAVRGRAVQAEAAESRATQAEGERDTAARIAVAEERTRIARELHDIVAHAVSVMVLQVGAVRHELPAALYEDREALKGVEQVGRDALAEMRHLLDAMREDGERAELGPQPGLDRLDALLRDVGRAGLPVRLHVGSDPLDLPRGIDISAYRIVQEGLTNVLKHAHATQAEVALDYAPDQLRIEVSDNGHGAASSDSRGHGLIGIHERVKLYGGEMTTATTNGGGFSLTEPDIEVAAEARNGLEAVAKAARFKPTVILMDLRMPELDGLEATRRIIAADNTARILILTTFGLDEYVYEALCAGANGFVLKDDPPEQLIAAVHTVAAGDALLSPAFTKRVIRQFTRIPRPAPPKELDELTAREHDILLLIARGLSNSEIGQQLYISETTVKTHVTHILAKLGLRDRVQAVILAYQARLFEKRTTGESALR